MQSLTPLEIALRRDRLVVLAGLVGIAMLAWAYTAHMAYEMEQMHIAMAMPMPMMQSWSLVDFISMFLMWTVMMVAMMTPTAAPMILAFANINRKQRERERPYVASAVFLSGYLLVWTGFSVLATLAQWGLHEAALLSPMMVSTSPKLGGALLLAAGIFQWTPLKRVCLTHCRSPMAFFMADWRKGRRGALVMGLKHGAYCTGCCWFLMALLFVAGVMNLLWCAVITAIVLIEKIAPGGDLFGRIAGVALCIAGIVMLVQ